jgi:hypothetical protein
LPILIHCFTCLHLPLLSSPNLSHTTSPSYILTTRWLAYSTNCTQH